MVGGRGGEQGVEIGMRSEGVCALGLSLKHT
jgi:hypothetical protein